MELMLTEGFRALKLLFVDSVVVSNGMQCELWELVVIVLLFGDSRFLTNPDLPGTEKISATKVPKEFLDAPYSDLPSTIGGQTNIGLLCSLVSVCPSEAVKTQD